jgi:hypothetical protein
VSETNLSKVAHRAVHIASVDFKAGRKYDLYNYIFPHFLSNDIVHFVNLSWVRKEASGTHLCFWFLEKIQTSIVLSKRLDY